ncbi:MAG TPA: COX15/CtaA family protein [Gammaproteobacteria bacterium]
MPADHSVNLLGRLALLGAVLAFCVVILGAFVRLSYAGLGCPDWPVCYGHLTWPTEEAQIETANTAFPERPVEVEKAWKEQVHRFLAAMLGMIVFALALLASWRTRGHRYLLFAAAAAAAAGIVTYVKGWIPLASFLSALSILLPLYGMFAWRDENWRARFTAGLLALIIVQAMLGMWTVTLLVKPIIVTGHLLGGMATFVLLLLLWLRDRNAPKVNQDGRHSKLRRFAIVALGVVIVQIFLGGWTSTNYAAFACPGFPQCQAQWVPPMDFAEGFQLWRGLGVDYEGGVLGLDARVAIHYTHRLGAMLVLLVTGLLLLTIWRGTRKTLRDDASLRVLGAVVGIFLAVQVLLGISVVKFGLPTWLAVAHNGGAALLLASITALSYALTPSRDA